MIDPKLLRVMARNLEKLASVIESSGFSGNLPVYELLSGGITEDFLESLGFVSIERYKKLRDRIDELEKELEKRDRFINEYIKNELSPWQNLVKLYKSYGEMTEKILEFFKKTDKEE